MTAEIDMPHIVEAELITVITDWMNAHPRSLQKRIGPSEVGHPCARKLIHKLAGHSEPGGMRDRWLAQVGTMCHTGMETAFRQWNEVNCPAAPRYLLEHQVTVGQVGGEDITGHSDLFDIDSGTVVDWKFVGADQLLKYKARGPGPQYRAQAHLYGRGFAQAGYTVNTVMIAFMPRSGSLGRGELHTNQPKFKAPGNRHFWSEPYDESVALQALARLEGLSQLLAAVGPETLLGMYPACNDYFCPWCSRPHSAMNTAQLFGEVA